MERISYNNIILYIPQRYYNDNLINRFENKSYEKDEEKIVKTFYNNDDIVLEMGSCIGYITNLLSKKVKRVLSIEGNPELKDSLEKCKKTNDLKNVIFYNTFISNTIDYIDFQTYDCIVAGSGDRKDKLFNNVRGWGDTQKIYKIKTTKFQDIPNINDINSLFMDIEGGELNILNENIDFIKKNIKKITFEVHGHLMYGDGHPKSYEFNNKCFKILTDNGFILKHNSGCTYHFEK